MQSIGFNGGDDHISTSYYTKKIEAYKTSSPALILDDVYPSTLTAIGFLNNVSFNEEHIFTSLQEPDGQIVMIGCNYGEKYNSKYVEIDSIKIKKEKSTRGRKPKNTAAKRIKRKIQGTGDYFCSQITFIIEHPDLIDVTGNKVRYNIKLFRTGKVQIPGVQKMDMSDIIEPLNVLCAYMSRQMDNTVDIKYMSAVMRNYKTNFLNAEFLIDLKAVEKLLSREKMNIEYEKYLDNMLENVSDEHCNNIKNLMGNYNPLNLAETSYNTDRHASLVIKVYRSSDRDINKKTTIKILKKGKINIDGANSHLEAMELYYWLNDFCTKNCNAIFVHKSEIKNLFQDTSSCSENSIYDDDEARVIKFISPSELLSNMASLHNISYDTTV